MAPDERRTQDGAGNQFSRPEASGANTPGSKTNPLHLALAELQGEFLVPEPAARVSEPPRQASREVPPPQTPPPAAAVSSAYAQPHGSGSYAPESRGTAGVPPRPPERNTQGTSFDSDFELSSESASDAALSPPRHVAVVQDQTARRAPAASLAVIIGASTLTSLIFGTVGAWLYEQMLAPSAPAQASGGSADNGKGAAGSSESSSLAQIKPEMESLRGQLERMKDRQDQIQKQLDSLSSSGTSSAAVDLSSLQHQLDELSKQVHTLPSISQGLASLMARVDLVEKERKPASHEVASTNPRASASASHEKEPATTGSPFATTDSGATSPPPLSEPERRDTSAPIIQPIEGKDDPLSQGADLFKQGKYQDALGIFTQLTKNEPDDARIWYFAALSRGFATRQWTGETLRLVQKGVAREKAGTPSTAEIDAAFRGLSTENVKSDNGKKWLEFYRQTAKAR